MAIKEFWEHTVITKERTILHCTFCSYGTSYRISSNTQYGKIYKLPYCKICINKFQTEYNKCFGEK